MSTVYDTIEMPLIVIPVTPLNPVPEIITVDPGLPDVGENPEIKGNGFTDIVIALEIAGLPVTHSALEVITHVIEFPFANPELVYVGLSVPTSVAPFFH